LIVKTINIFVKEYVKRSSPKDYKRGYNPFFYVINTYMKDKKAAKLILKRAKKNPIFYSSADISYAKKVKKLKKDALSHKKN